MKSTINLDDFKVGKVYELKFRSIFSTSGITVLCTQKRSIYATKTTQDKFFVLSGPYAGITMEPSQNWLDVFVCEAKEVATSFKEEA